MRFAWRGARTDIVNTPLRHDAFTLNSSISSTAALEAAILALAEQPISVFRLARPLKERRRSPQERATGYYDLCVLFLAVKRWRNNCVRRTQLPVGTSSRLPVVPPPGMPSGNTGSYRTGGSPNQRPIVSPKLGPERLAGKPSRYEPSLSVMAISVRGALSEHTDNAAVTIPRGRAGA